MVFGMGISIIGSGWGPYRWLGMGSSIVGWAWGWGGRIVGSGWGAPSLVRDEELHRWLGMGDAIALRAH